MSNPIFTESVFEIDKDTKIVCHDYSLKCSRPNLITIKILRKIRKEWKKIGEATIEIKEKLRTAKWSNIEIGSDEPNLLTLLEPIPNPMYEYRKFRNMGIGSKTVQFMLGYLKQNGIEEVYGEVSRRENVEKTLNFWRKNGFALTPYDKPDVPFVAKISKKITEPFLSSLHNEK